MLKAIIFDLDAEMRLAKQSILTRKSYHPLSGLGQILQTLALDGICLTMISSLPKMEIIESCHSAEIQDYFQHLISTDELKYTESIQKPPIADEKTKQAELVQDPPVADEKTKQAEPIQDPPVADEKTKQAEPIQDPPIADEKTKQAEPISELLALALRRSGVTPSEALLICDSDLGIGAAKAAAIPCIAFHPLYSEQPDLRNADILLESFDGLNPSFFFQVYHRFHGEPITIASTEHLWIRELTTEDIPKLCAIYQDPDIRRFITDIDDNIEDEIARQTAYIDTVYRFYGYGLWGIFHKKSDTLIGRCGIENHKIAGKEEIMLSYLLEKNYWGLGYALEACQAVLQYAREELDMKRIVAVIDLENSRSLRTAANLGMESERELIYKNHPCILFVLE